MQTEHSLLIGSVFLLSLCNDTTGQYRAFRESYEVQFSPAGTAPEISKLKKKIQLQFVLFLVQACGLSIKAPHVWCALLLF